MSVLDMVTEMRERLALRQQVKARQERSSDITSRRNRLERERQGLERAMSDAKALCDGGLCAPTDFAHIDLGGLSGASVLKEKLTDNDASGRVQRFPEYNLLLTALSVAAQAFRDSSAEHLRQLRADIQSDLASEPDLNAFGFKEKARPIIRAIRTSRASLEANYRGTLSSTAEVKRVRGLHDEYLVARGRIEEIHMDPQIKAFILRAMKDRGVPLTSLTPELLQKLKEQGVIQSFFVKARSPDQLEGEQSGGIRRDRFERRR